MKQWDLDERFAAEHTGDADGFARTKVQLQRIAARDLGMTEPVYGIWCVEEQGWCELGAEGRVRDLLASWQSGSRAAGWSKAMTYDVRATGIYQIPSSLTSRDREAGRQ